MTITVDPPDIKTRRRPGLGDLKPMTIRSDPPRIPSREVLTHVFIVDNRVVYSDDFPHFSSRPPEPALCGVHTVRGLSVKPMNTRLCEDCYRGATKRGFAIQR